MEWLCPSCGSNRVQALTWIDANGSTFRDEAGEYYCPACETHSSHLDTRDLYASQGGER